MNVNPASPPPGWKAEWSPQYARYFYVNLATNESTWTLPATPPPQPPPLQRQHSIQRKPVPSQTSVSSNQTSTPDTKANFIEAYPTPPPQVTTGYFPPTPAPQQLAQAHLTQTSATIQQQYVHVTPTHQQQPHYAQHQAIPQHFSPAVQFNQAPVSFQQQPTPQLQQQYPQQSSYATPAASPNSSTVSRYAQQTTQTLSPPLTPSVQSPQIASNHAPAPYQQPRAYLQTGAKSVGQLAPQQQGISPCYPHQPNNFAPNPQHANGFFQNQQQAFAHPQQQVANFAQPSPQYQQGGHSYQTQAQAQQHQQGKRSSMMGGSMMNKMSSKFTSLQKGVTGPPTAASPNGKPADWKKWGKRAAIGVAGIGAWALGVDAAGDMFSGAEGLAGGDWSGGGGEFTGGGGDFTGGGGDFTGGGGDFTGFEGSGDAAGVMDAQTALEANNAQLTMEAIGHENSSMLLDPVGTEYVAVNDAAANQAALALI